MPWAVRLRHPDRHRERREARASTGASGETGREILGFMAYDPSYTGGVWVAAGDVNGDGFADIVTGAGIGGGPHVNVFDGRTGQSIMAFFAYADSLRDGVTVAATDINGDGRAEIVTGAGLGGAPHVRAFNPVDMSLVIDDVSISGA